MVVTDNDTCKIKVLETVHASFVRILEREVNALTAERDQLRTEVERLTKAAVPLCVGAPIIGILAREGQYISGDGQGLVAASDLFGNDPFARAERAEAIDCNINKNLK